MYLNKQKRINIEGNIAWLEQHTDLEEKVDCYNKDLLKFLKHIIEDQ